MRQWNSKLSRLRVGASAQRAFTLMEMLIVLLILGVLVTIAAPAYLGRGAQATDMQAKETVYAVHDAAKSLAYVENDGAYPTTDQVILALTQGEPAYAYRDALASTSYSQNPYDVAVQVNDPDTLTVCSASVTGIEYCARFNERSQLQYTGQGSGSSIPASDSGGGFGGQLMGAFEPASAQASANLNNPLPSPSTVAVYSLGTGAHAEEDAIDALSSTTYPGTWDTGPGGTGKPTWDPGADGSNAQRVTSSGDSGTSTPQAAPSVTITSAPTSTTSTDASFAYATAGGPVSSTACTLDGQGADCASGSPSFTNLAVGAHTFAVTVSGPGGSASANANWTVTATVTPPAPPTVSITSAPASSTSTSADISYTDGGGPVSSTSCALDGATVGCGAGSASLTGLAYGAHTFTVTVTGSGGSGSDNATWTVLNPPDPPGVSITSAPQSSAATTASVTYATSGTVTASACELDSQNVPCASGNPTFSGLNSGSHTFQVTVSGPGGVASTAASWTVLAPPPPPPTVALTSVPALSSTNTSTTIAFTTAGGTFTTETCLLDQAPVNCGSGTVALTGMSYGSHSFQVVVSGAGGADSASTTWTVVAPPAAPTVSITSAPANSQSTSATVAYSASGSVSSTACTLDGSATACSATSASFAGLSVATHTFAVTVSGPGGSNSASTSWAVASPPAAPTVTITSAPANSMSTSATVTYTTAGGSVTSIACTLDGSPTACSSTSASFTGLSAATHTFAVTVSGPGGSNSASASWTVASPPAAPTVVIVTAPPASSTNTAATITYSEGGSVTGTACTLDGQVAGCGASLASFSGLSLGAHTFTVTVTGPGGSGSASDAWTVLAAAPTVSITSSPSSSTSSTSATISYGSGGSVTSTACTLDGAPVACTASLASFSGMSVASHVFVVTVTGPGGSASASVSWTVTAAPKDRLVLRSQGDYAVSTDPPHPTGAFEVGAWVRLLSYPTGAPNSIPDPAVIAADGCTSSNGSACRKSDGGWSLGIDGSGYAHFVIHSTGNGNNAWLDVSGRQEACGPESASPAPVSLDAWHYVEGSYDPIFGIRVSVDGKVQDCLAGPLSVPLIQTTMPLWVGASVDKFDNPAYFVDGDIGPVRMTVGGALAIPVALGPLAALSSPGALFSPAENGRPASWLFSMRGVLTDSMSSLGALTLQGAAHLGNNTE